MTRNASGSRGLVWMMNALVMLAPTIRALSASAVSPDSAGISMPTAPASSNEPIRYRNH
jgi:hypothetical protein